MSSCRTVRAIPWRQTLSRILLLASLCVVLGGFRASPSDAQTGVSVEGVVESTSGGFRFPDGTLQTTACLAPLKAPVGRTGQFTCWDTQGFQIPCGDSGQDASFLAGVEWPSPRFSANGDGTVTDGLTGLTWLRDAGCFAPQSWADASATVAAFNAGSTSCDGYVAGTFDDWRLPNVKELSSLSDRSRLGPAIATEEFVNIGSFYWSSTSTARFPTSAWIWVSGSGGVANHDKDTNSDLVWPVRGGE